MVILGDSMLSNIRKKELNRCIKGNGINGVTNIKSFSGANCEDMKSYNHPSLKNKEIDLVIIHIGTNDISNSFRTNQSVKEIANDIMKVANSAKKSTM